MKPKIVIISLLFLFFGCKEYPKAKHKEYELLPAEISLQKAGLVKDTLYFLYKEIRLPNGLIKNEPFYEKNEQGVIFNLTDDGKSYESFLFEDGSISETLDIEELEKYKITSIGKVDSVHKSWHKKK